MSKVQSYRRFIKKNRKPHFWGVLLVIIIIPIWVLVTNNSVDYFDIVIDTNENTKLWWWADWLDPIIGVGVFITTLIIGWTQLKEDWRENLPKRLTVIFKYKGREVMVCRKAFLTSEADVRQLGQQIGSQMNNGQHLKFYANDIEPKILGEKPNEFQKGKFFMHYQVEFELIHLPKELEKMKCVWYEPETNRGMEWIELDTMNVYKSSPWKNKRRKPKYKNYTISANHNQKNQRNSAFSA